MKLILQMLNISTIIELSYLKWDGEILCEVTHSVGRMRFGQPHQLRWDPEMRTAVSCKAVYI